MGITIKKSCLLQFFALPLFLALFSNVPYAATLEVGTGKKYSSIQTAVNASNCGDTIIIHNGTYRETIRIDNSNPGLCSNSSPLKIQSAGTGVIIDADGNDNCISIINTSYIEWDNTAEGRIRLQNCGTAYYDPSHGSYNGHGIYLQNSTDFKIKGFNIISSGSSPSKFPHEGGDNPDNPMFRRDANGVEIRQMREVTTRSDWSEIAHIDINCDNCFSQSLHVIFGNKIKIHHIKAIRSGSKYTCFLKGNNDIIFEKNYCWYSNDVKSYNDTASGGDRVRGMSFRLRDSERAIVRFNVFDSSGSSGQMMDVLINDEDHEGGLGFDYEIDQNENFEYYNNTEICDLSPESSVTYACLSFSGPISNSTFYNNLIYVTNNEIAIDKRYCSNESDYVLNNFSFNKNTSQNSYSCDSINFVLKNRTIGDPSFTKSGDKPYPYYMSAESIDSIVDAGSNSINYNGTDYTGNPQKYGVWDIGAFEYTTEIASDKVPPNPPTLISLD